MGALWVIASVAVAGMGLVVIDRLTGRTLSAILTVVCNTLWRK